MNKIKVAICDDFVELLDAYKAEFKFYDSIELVGLAKNREECLIMVKEKKPDILLLDITMDTDKEGIDLLPELLSLHSDLKIVMLTSYDDDDYIFEAFAHGAVDYIVKSYSFERIVEKIISINNGEYLIDSNINKKLLKHTMQVEENQKSLMYFINKLVRLSPSELDILKCIYNGKTYKQIAKEKYIEEGTVRAHASNILKKVGGSDMNTLVSQLKKNKLFEYLDI